MMINEISSEIYLFSGSIMAIIAVSDGDFFVTSLCREALPETVRTSSPNPASTVSTAR